MKSIPGFRRPVLVIKSECAGSAIACATRSMTGTGDGHVRANSSRTDPDVLHCLPICGNLLNRFTREAEAYKLQIRRAGPAEREMMQSFKIFNLRSGFWALFAFALIAISLA